MYWSNIDVFCLLVQDFQKINPACRDAVKGAFQKLNTLAQQKGIRSHSLRMLNRYTAFVSFSCSLFIIHRLQPHPVCFLAVQNSLHPKGHSSAERTLTQRLHHAGHVGLSLQHSFHGQHASLPCEGTGLVASVNFENSVTK